MLQKNELTKPSLLTNDIKMLNTQIAEKTGLSVGAIKSYFCRYGLNTESIINSSGSCKTAES